MNNYDESELLFRIFRLKNSDGVWMPAIEDVTNHDITPLWVAGTAYLIIDRYLSCVSDDKQQDFYEEVLFHLTKMLKDTEGTKYIDRFDKRDDLEK